MSKKKVLKSMMIAMLAVAFAILPALSGGTENVMATVKKCETASGSAVTAEPASGSAVDQNVYMCMNANYMDFKISCSDGSYAIVKSGNKVEGDLNVSFLDIRNEPGEEYDVDFRIPPLDKGECYTIIPDAHQRSNASQEQELAVYDTIIGLNTSYGNVASVRANVPVTLIVHENGDVQTRTENGEAVTQDIGVGYGEPSKYIGETYLFTVQGTDSGFAITNTEHQLHIQSEHQVEVNVIVRESYQSIYMDHVSTESGMINLSGSGNSYTITDANGNELAHKDMGYYVHFRSKIATDVLGYSNVPAGSLVEEPEKPERNGYEFAGWYTTSNCEEGTKWDFSKDVVTENIILYAKWVELPNETEYTVYFVSDVTKNKPVAFVRLGKNSTIPVLKSITKEGYELEGWYTTSTFEEGTKWDFSKDVVTENIILYAKWIKKETTKTIVKPAKVKNVTVKNNSKKAVKISWKKVSKATGYEIVYCTKKNFKNVAVKKVTTSANSKTIKNLKKGKTYYFKVRAYKKSGKDKITGAYSAVKKVKIKK